VAENERPLHALELMKAGFPDFDMQPYDHRLRMIRSGDHKLIWREGRGVELYDLAADPQEQHDLAADDPVTRDRLLALLEDWMDEHPVTPESPKSILESQDPRAVEQLRALGYVD
jgi:arylsulfatase A-like enzyme